MTPHTAPTVKLGRCLQCGNQMAWISSETHTCMRCLRDGPPDADDWNDIALTAVGIAVLTLGAIAIVSAMTWANTPVIP